MQKLLSDIRKFVGDRDWGRFHSPKNLSMALVVEAAELVELFQWALQDDAVDVCRVEDEIADVLIYLLLLADKFGIDIVAVTRKKLEVNAKRYPVDVVKGSAKKYTEY